MLTIKKEINLSDFEFWSGAVYVRDYVEKVGLMDDLERILNEEYPDGIDETELNDLLWHDGDTVAQWLGYRNENALRRDAESYDDEEEED